MVSKKARNHAEKQREKSSPGQEEAWESPQTQQESTGEVQNTWHAAGRGKKKLSNKSTLSLAVVGHPLVAYKSKQVQVENTAVNQVWSSVVMTEQEFQEK